MLRASIAELVGTFSLTFIAAGAIINGAGGLVGIALAYGLALSMAVYTTGHISGGHVNPAVTLAMFATRRIRLSKAVAYIVAQLLGATIAAFALKALFDPEAVTTLGATLGSERSPTTVLLVEAILTFLLVTTIFGVVVDKRGPKNVYGFAIGLTVAFDMLCAFPITGASMNPARSFGPALVGGHWDIHQAYWLGPIAGACIAALLYDMLLIPKNEKQAD